MSSSSTQIAIVADRSIDVPAWGEIEAVLPLLGADVRAVWVEPGRFPSADLSRCDGVWFVPEHPGAARTPEEDAAYTRGHQAQAQGVPVLSTVATTVPAGSLTAATADPRVLAFIHEARRHAQGRALPEQHRHQAAERARLEAIPRPYVHQLRGPGHRWWRPLLTLALILLSWIAIGGTLTLPFAVAGSLEGADAGAMTPGSMLWLNLLLAALIPATLIGVRLGADRPAGRALSVTGRLRWGWLAQAMLVLTPLWVAYLALVWVLSGQEVLTRPSSWVGMALVTLLTTPLQAAGEEVFFRGGLVQTLGAWLSNPVIAALVTTAVSTAAFVAAHGSGDVWIWIDIGSLAVAACYLAWRTGGLEAAIAIHVINNLLITFQGIVLGGLEQSYVDTESTGSPGAALMSVGVMALASGLLLWVARRKGIAPRGWLTPAVG